MSPSNRLLLRAAARLQSAYHAARTGRCHFDLPETSWLDVGKVLRRWTLARSRGWSAAANLQRESLVETLDALCDQLQSQARLLQADDRPRVPALRTLYEELIATSAEFGGLEIEDSQLVVTTDSIVLEGIPLGPFQIRLELDRTDGEARYCIMALEPNPATSCAETTHPHVNCENLCSGEGRAAINAALKEGRLFDFFVIVDRILHTYAEGSAFVELSRWYGTPCHDCDCSLDGDDASYCLHCGETFCGDCLLYCNGCSDGYCSDCIHRCERCDDWYCRNCLGKCGRCGNSVCETCLEAQLCITCREELEDEAEEQIEEVTTTTPSPTLSLRFSPYAWAKLIYLRDRGETEIGGFGLSAESDPLLIVDLLAVKQRCTPVSVAFDDTAVADLFDDLVDHGLQPERFGRIWIHTHPGDCPLPSRTDESTYDRVFGRTNWSVMAIIARSDASYARLSFHAGPGGALEIPVRIDYSGPFDGADWEAWDQEYEENVIADEFRPAVQANGVLTGPLFDDDLQDLWDWREFYDDTAGARSL